MKSPRTEPVGYTISGFVDSIGINTLNSGQLACHQNVVAESSELSYRFPRMPQAWSPLRQLENFQREFDELFDRFLQARWRLANRPRPVPIVYYMEGDQLPGSTQTTEIKASYRNGVLELRVPLPGKPAARKVTVRVENE